MVSIGVQHVRRYALQYRNQLVLGDVLTIDSFNLPDDVFEAGETKPQKKSGGVKGPQTGKKRGAQEVLDSQPPLSLESKMRRYQ